MGSTQGSGNEPQKKEGILTCLFFESLRKKENEKRTAKTLLNDLKWDLGEKKINNKKTLKKKKKLNTSET